MCRMWHVYWDTTLRKRQNSAQSSVNATSISNTLGSKNAIILLCCLMLTPHFLPTCCSMTAQDIVVSTFVYVYQVLPGGRMSYMGTFIWDKLRWCIQKMITINQNNDTHSCRRKATSTDQVFSSLETFITTPTQNELTRTHLRSHSSTNYEYW